MSVSNRTSPRGGTLRTSACFVVRDRLGEQQVPEETQLFQVHGLEHVLRDNFPVYLSGRMNPVQPRDSTTHPQRVGVLTNVSVKFLHVFAVLSQLRRDVEVLIFQLVVQSLHIELL